MTPADIALQFAERMRDEGVPAWVIYHDDKGWHLAGPAAPALPEGLRSVAEQYEARARAALN